MSSLDTLSLTDGLSGSGGTGETHFIFAPTPKRRCGRERRSRCPLEPVLGGIFSDLAIQILTPVLKCRFDRIAITQVMNNGIPTKMEK